MSESKKIGIIGAGPSGLTAAIYASRANLETTVFTGIQPGGQLTTTTEIENFPGAWNPETKQGMMGPDLMQIMQKQAEHFGSKIIYASADKLSYNPEEEKGKFIIENAEGKHFFDAVIVASGASARYLGLPGEERLIGKGYHSCATCDGFFYRGKTIAVVGGGDSAMEEANFLTKFAQKVYLIHRSDSYKASKIMLDRAKNNPKIEFLPFKQIVEMVGEDKLEHVIIQDSLTEEKSQLDVSGVFVAIGHTPNSGFAQNLLDKDASGYLIPQIKKTADERTSKYITMSNIPGIFVSGDVEDTVYRQAVTAAANGAKAAIDCERWLEEN